VTERPPGRSDDDVVLVRGPTEDGQGVGIVRKRGEKLEVGELRAAAQGKPLQGELVRLHARAAPGLYDVEVLYDGTATAREEERRGRKGARRPRARRDRRVPRRLGARVPAGEGPAELTPCAPSPGTR